VVALICIIKRIYCIPEPSFFNDAKKELRIEIKINSNVLVVLFPSLVEALFYNINSANCHII